MIKHVLVQALFTICTLFHWSDLAGEGLLLLLLLGDGVEPVVPSHFLQDALTILVLPTQDRIGFLYCSYHTSRLS